MKKFLVLVILCFLLSSCKHVSVCGGYEKITLPVGMRLVDVAWKEYNLWYLLEPMEEDYVPKTKVLVKNSNSGFVERKITFVETR